MPSERMDGMLRNEWTASIRIGWYTPAPGAAPAPTSPLASAWIVVFSRQCPLHFDNQAPTALVRVEQQSPAPFSRRLLSRAPLRDAPGPLCPGSVELQTADGNQFVAYVTAQRQLLPAFGRQAKVQFDNLTAHIQRLLRPFVQIDVQPRHVSQGNSSSQGIGR